MTAYFLPKCWRIWKTTIIYKIILAFSSFFNLIHFLFILWKSHTFLQSILVIYIFQSPSSTPSWSLYHNRLPNSWPLFLNLQSLMRVSHIYKGVEPFSGTWAIYQGPLTWRKLTLPLLAIKYQQILIILHPTFIN